MACHTSHQHQPCAPCLDRHRSCVPHDDAAFMCIMQSDGLLNSHKLFYEDQPKLRCLWKERIPAADAALSCPVIRPTRKALTLFTGLAAGACRTAQGSYLVFRTLFMMTPCGSCRPRTLSMLCLLACTSWLTSASQNWQPHQRILTL